MAAHCCPLDQHHQCWVHFQSRNFGDRRVLTLTSHPQCTYMILFHLFEIYGVHVKEMLFIQLTSVFLGALVRSGDGNGVEHAAVLPSVVGVADALHLVTACLRTRRDVVWLFCCLRVRRRAASDVSQTEVEPRGASRSWRTTTRGRSSGWRCWRGGSGAPDTSCWGRRESRLPRSPDPCRRPARRGPPCRATQAVNLPQLEAEGLCSEWSYIRGGKTGASKMWRSKRLFKKEGRFCLSFSLLDGL